jgi:hypothetical protein
MILLHLLYTESSDCMCYSGSRSCCDLDISQCFFTMSHTYSVYWYQARSASRLLRFLYFARLNHNTSASTRCSSLTYFCLAKYKYFLDRLFAVLQILLAFYRTFQVWLILFLGIICDRGHKVGGLSEPRINYCFNNNRASESELKAIREVRRRLQEIDEVLDLS